MANLAAVTAFAGAGDAVIVDRLCHASIIDAVRLSGARLLVCRHRDLAAAERVLKRAASYRRRLYITESLFSMDGDFAPLLELSRLCRRYETMSLVDEAHAIGVWGESGRGVLGLSEAGVGFDIVIGTLSKALGSQGGFVGASRAVVETLVNRARPFIFTTGLSPACAGAARAALGLLREDPAPRRHVQRLSAQLRAALRSRGFDLSTSESQIIPIVLGTPERVLEASARLESRGIFAPAIRPPTVHPGQCRLRLSVTAEHTEDDIQALMEALS
jgi:7-keto-8-aminopelargonate synthetase-like enzyme